MSLHADAAVAVAVLLAGLSAILAFVGLLTWRRVGHPKLAWIALAFVLFTGQGIYLARDAYQRRGELASGWDALPWLGLVDLLIVACLYLAVLRR